MTEEEAIGSEFEQSDTPSAETKLNDESEKSLEQSPEPESATSKSVKKEKSPLLGINLGRLSINIGSRILGPALGSIQINLFSSKKKSASVGGSKKTEADGTVTEATEDEVKEKDFTVLGLKIGGGLLGSLLGNVNLSLLNHMKKQSDATTKTKTFGLLGLGIEKSPLLGTTKIGVLGGQKTVSGSRTTVVGGLATVDLKNQLLGSTHLGVLEGVTDETDTYRYTSGGLAKVNLDNPLLGKADVALVTGETYESDTVRYTNGGLASVHLDNPITGKADIGLVERETYKSEDLSYSRSGLASVGLEDSVLGDVHVDVIHAERLKTDEYTASNFGIIDLKTEDTPIIGDTNIGIGIGKKSSVEFRNPVDDIKPILPGKPIVKPVQPIVKPALPIVNPGLPIQPERPIIGPEYPILEPELPGIPVIPVKPMEKPESPRIVIDTEQPTVDLVQVVQWEDHDGIADVQTDLNELLTAEDQLLLDPVTDDALVAAIQQLLEAGNKLVLNEPTQLGVQASKKYPIEKDHHTSVTTAVIQGSSSSGPGSSGSSGTSSTSSSSQAETFSGHLDTMKYIERETSTLAGSRVKTLKTKWTEPPPTKPPRKTFFLS